MLKHKFDIDEAEDTLDLFAEELPEQVQVALGLPEFGQFGKLLHLHRLFRERRVSRELRLRAGIVRPVTRTDRPP
jgi:hypothetical protein